MLANAVCQAAYLQLSWHIRQQAGSCRIHQTHTMQLFPTVRLPTLYAASITGKGGQSVSEHIVHFHCGVEQTTTEHFRDRCLEALGQGATGLLLNLCTAGGSTALGFTIYNFLKSLKVPIRALNSGNIESMGIVIYLAAQERIVCPHSRFLIHPMSWYFNQSSVDHSRMREYLRSLDNDLQRYVNIYLSETEGAASPLKIGRSLSSEEKVIRAEDSMACGIAHRMERLQFDEDAVHRTVSAS